MWRGFKGHQLEHLAGKVSAVTGCLCMTLAALQQVQFLLTHIAQEGTFWAQSVISAVVGSSWKVLGADLFSLWNFHGDRKNINDDFGAAGEAAWLYFLIQLSPADCKKLWADGNSQQIAGTVYGNRKSAAVIHYETVLVSLSISSECCLRSHWISLTVREK